MHTASRKEDILGAIAVVILLIGTATGSAYVMLGMSVAAMIVLALFIGSELGPARFSPRLWLPSPPPSLASSSPCVEGSSDGYTHMSYTSTADPKFLDTVESWFRTHSELLVLIRFHASAGSKSFEFFSAFDALIERLCGLPQRTCVIVFRQPQLPLRGNVDDAFIDECLHAIPDGSEYVMTELEQRTVGVASWFSNAVGISHDELREDLDSSRGRSVAVGLYPPWLEDCDDVISAVVPDEHGVVQIGVY